MQLCSNVLVLQMAKRSNESDVWKSCKRLDDGKHMLHVRFVGKNCPVEAVQPAETRAFTAPVGVQCTDTNSEFMQINKRLYKRH